MSKPDFFEIFFDTRIRLGLYKDITDVTFVTMLEWFKKEGEVIKGISDSDTQQVVGEPLCYIVGAKGKKIIEALDSEIGRRIKKILVPAGKTVTFDLRKTPLRLAELEDVDDALGDICSSVKILPAEKICKEVAPRISPAARRAAMELGIAAEKISSNFSAGTSEIRAQDVLQLDSRISVKHGGSPRDILAAPATRRMAKKFGVDLKDVIPTGSGGLILPCDIDTHLKELNKNSSVKADAENDGDVELITPDAFRLTVALNVQHAVNGNFTPGRGMNIPTAGDGVDVNMAALAVLRKKLKSAFETEEGVTLGFESFFLAATAKILREEKFRHLNSCWEWLEDRSAQIVRFRHVNLAIPVAGSNGLMMPVLKNCESKSFREIARNSDELVKKAIEGRLSEEEQEGFTFTVNNSGALGGEDPSPIVPIGTGVIAAFGHIRENKIMRVNMRFDHRLFDGHHIIPFLIKLKELLEFPEKILIM